MIGQTISHYEITAKLGEGGMGVVYKAEDTKLKRAVALKFLAAHLLQDEEARKRFQREAQAAAALHHPNVCPVYEISEVDGQTFLVMAFIEGRSLDKTIEKGPVKLPEALDIAQQVAKGLEAAHEKGVVHRDIKPGNVMLDDKGHVTVMDFGLALLTEGSKLTKFDTTVGTVAYMSPEQAQGMEVDHRTDVWALGCVLYEMVRGERPFQGLYDQALLYEIVHEEPEPLTSVRTGVPVELELLVNKCFAKQADNRYQAVADLIVDLRTLSEKLKSGRPSPAATARIRASAPPEIGTDSPQDAQEISEPSRKPLSRFALPAAIAAAAVFYSLWMMERSQPDPPRPATRTVVTLPDSARLSLGTQYPPIGFDFPALALSPDGRYLAYVGQAEEGTRLYYRDLTRFEDPRPIPGTEGAVYAFFSPDSSELGFLTQDRVKKVALAGGAPTTLCRARTPFSATWNDDTIYFSDSAGLTLAGVPAAGGEPSEIIDSFERFGARAIASAVLPGGRAALVSVVNRASTSSDYNQIWVASLEGSDDKVLPVTGFDPRYLPSGHLVFGRGSSLLAAPFDVESLELTGDAVPVLEGVALESIFGQAHAAFAGNGTVAFVPGNDLARGRLAWVDSQGNEGVLEVPERVYGVFDVAPDDRRFAVQVADVRDYVWIWDAERGGRNLPSPASVGWPVWSPDGTALAVRSIAPGEATENVLIHDIQGGTAERLLSSESTVYPDSWAQAGRIAVSGWNRGVGVFSVASPRDLLWARENPRQSPRVNRFAALSPDGSLIAYTSNDGTGRFQVWVEEVDGNNRVQVSTDNGTEPVWCRQCGELFYREGNRYLASRITRKPRLEISPPRVVFEAPDFVDTASISFRVSSDGRRAYYVRRGQSPVRDRIHIVHNWFEELERRAPVRGSL